MSRNQTLIKIGFYKMNKLETISSFPENQWEEIKSGGKVVLPARVLQRCMNFQNISSPLIFKLVKGSTSVFCGAISFEGEDGKVLVPAWMMEQLQSEAGASVTVFAQLGSLVPGEMAVFQPQSSTFLDISNPKAVLERSLRNYACITRGDVLSIPYNGAVLRLRVHSTKPARTINITDCDLNVDFLPPTDYVEPVKEEREPETFYDNTFSPFTGQSRRLDGRPLTQEQLLATPSKKILSRGVPDENYTIGRLQFVRKPADIAPPTNTTPEEPEEQHSDVNNDDDIDDETSFLHRMVTRRSGLTGAASVPWTRSMTRSVNRMQTPSGSPANRNSTTNDSPSTTTPNRNNPAPSDNLLDILSNTSIGGRSPRQSDEDHHMEVDEDESTPNVSVDESGSESERTPGEPQRKRARRQKDPSNHFRNLK